jgi:GMP synthase-like glutamine amidotransferase
MRVLVLQHIACEPPALYGDVMREHGVERGTVELDEGERLPGLDDFDAIVAMGGPMSVNDEAELPWLVDEKRLVADAVRAGTPYFGACLGVQLLASSLGARVYEGPAPEVGLMPVTLTDEAAADPVFAGLPRELPTFQWHGDTFDLPEGAVLLATSPAYPHQAVRVGERAYGVQFHLEVSPELVREWAAVPAYAAALERVLGPGSVPRLLSDFSAAAEELARHGRALFERWLALATERRADLDAALRTR